MNRDIVLEDGSSPDNPIKYIAITLLKALRIGQALALSNGMA